MVGGRQESARENKLWDNCICWGAADAAAAAAEAQ